MRIAQLAPLFESVPPHGYGGTERVLHYLTEELVRLGHDVTLFASGDSVTAAELISAHPRSLRMNPITDPMAPHIAMLGLLDRRIDDFDIVHFHIDYLHFPFSVHLPLMKHVTTLHGRLDIPELQEVYKQFYSIPIVSISDYQRSPIPWANWQATVYHGLPPDLYRCHERPEPYLAFLGRIAAEKRVDRAIEIAERAGMPLKIAAKIDPRDLDYYSAIKPLLNSPYVEFIGEIDEDQKNDFLGKARALLFPVDWPEPFGLVMIEALACGTPIIAYRNGSVPEIIREGQTGYIVQSIEQAVRAVENIDRIDRLNCRKDFEERFTVEAMTRQYVKVYESLCADTRRVLRRVWRDDARPSYSDCRSNLRPGKLDASY